MADPGLRGSLRRFVCARDGISAVEFALILPFMLTLYLGGSELGDGMAIQFKATLAARTVADLATQYTNIPDSTTMNQILGAASTVVTPIPDGGHDRHRLGINAHQWQHDGDGRLERVQHRQRASPEFDLPASDRNARRWLRGILPVYLILGEVTYPYTPSMGYVITGTINIYEDVVFSPRLASCVQYTVNGSPTPASC